MSHIATVEVKFKDANVIKAAAQKLGYECKEVKNYKFYDGTVKSGISVQLPGWSYPVVFTEDGEAFFDNYNGHWGKQEELNKFTQHYGVEKAKKQAKIKGWNYREVKGQNGEVKVVINV
jgi:hypothetical protein